jgi:hypothetical protein
LAQLRYKKSADWNLSYIGWQYLDLALKRNLFLANERDRLKQRGLQRII